LLAGSEKGECFLLATSDRVVAVEARDVPEAQDLISLFS